MIIQDHGAQSAVIRQTDHARLAGFFARQWGSSLFSKPEPFESFCLAAEAHDNGWLEWEMFPAVDSATFSPYSFMSIPTEEHIALYQRGLARLIQADPYAGLLACMHCEQLYDHTRATMPGYSSKYVKSADKKPVEAFIESLRLQKLRLKVDLRAQQDLKPFMDDKLLAANAARLEAVDRLSLYFCMGARDAAIIDGVPVDAGDTHADLIVTPEGPDNAFTLAPYPFRRDALEFGVLARYIPKRRYTEDAELQRVLTAAPYSMINFTLRSADTHAGAFSAFA